MNLTSSAYVRSDGRSALLGVPLGKDVPVHVKQLGCIWRAVILSSVYAYRCKLDMKTAAFHAKRRYFHDRRGEGN